MSTQGQKIENAQGRGDEAKECECPHEGCQEIIRQTQEMRDVMRKILFALITAAAVLALTTPAMAQYRYYHYYQHPQYQYHQPDIGGAIIGGIIGGVVGGLAGTIAPQPPATYYPPEYMDPAVAACAQRFRSYDIMSRTYLGYDGFRHSCP